jgi:hypothetical protein
MFSHLSCQVLQTGSTSKCKLFSSVIVLVGDPRCSGPEWNDGTCKSFLKLRLLRNRLGHRIRPFDFVLEDVGKFDAFLRLTTVNSTVVVVVVVVVVVEVAGLSGLCSVACSRIGKDLQTWHFDQSALRQKCQFSALVSGNYEIQTESCNLFCSIALWLNTIDGAQRSR